MINLTSEQEVKELKEAFDYSFKGVLGKKSLEFLEDFCGFWNGGPRESLNQLMYEQGKRDVILTIKTIMKENWSPHKISEIYKRIEE